MKKAVSEKSLTAFELLVGTAGFELATPCTPCKCATRLRYAPKEKDYSRAKIVCTHSRKNFADARKIRAHVEHACVGAVECKGYPRVCRCAINRRTIRKGAPGRRNLPKGHANANAGDVADPDTTRSAPRQRNRDCATRLHKHAITHAAHGSSGHADFKNKGDVLPASTAPARGQRERKRNQAAGADTPED